MSSAATVARTTGFDFDPFSAESHRDPYPQYQVLRDRYPLYRNNRRDFWALSRFEDVQSAARDRTTFSNANGVDLDHTGRDIFGPGDFLDADPPLHDQLRNVVRKPFAPKAIKELEALVRGEAKALVDELSGGSETDLAEGFAWPLPIATIAKLLGLPDSDRPFLQDKFHAALERNLDDPVIPDAALDAAAELREYFTEMVDRKRSSPADDLLSMIAAAEIDGEPLREQAIGMSFLLLSAGTDTTASLLSNSLLLLSEHPEQRQRLVANMAGLPTAIEEILRYWSPVQNVIRTTTSDVEIHGQTVPEGERVVLLYGSANRDERRFDDPDRLDLTREAKRTLAFGEGIHHCLGAPLARLEGRVALEEFLRAFPHYEVTQPVERMKKQNAWGLRRLGATL